MKFEKPLTNQDLEDFTLAEVDENDIDSDSLGAARLTKGLVSETDDPLMPSLTFRVFVIGVLGSILLGFVNVVLSFRTNPTVITTTVITILAYPLGVLMATVLPRGFMNPGPFSIKEHALLTIMAGSAGGVAYGVDNVAGQYMSGLMNDKHVNFWNSLAYVMSTQLIGYGLSGMTRRFLIRPSAMVWPSALPTVATFLGFHQSAEDKKGDSKYPMSRYLAFWVAFLALFVWTIVPDYFATSLGLISIFCFFSTNQYVKLWISGSPNAGVGIGALTLDWTSFNSYGPMTTPWWASVNFYVAAILCNWIVLPIVWKLNPFGTPFLQSANAPVFADGTSVYTINTPALYMRNGSILNPMSMYNQTNFDLDPVAYQNFAPVYLSPYFAISYALSFLALTSSIAHVVCWYGSQIVKQVREMLAQQKSNETDVHNRLMESYPDIPEWMYLIFLGGMLIVQIFVLEYTPFYLPWYMTILGMIIPVFFLIPYGIIQAISGFQLGLNVITEFIIGMIMPGQTVSVMVFKSYSYNVFIQALNLTSDLKVGHYMHINPVHMVVVQLIGTIIGALTNTIGAFWIMDQKALIGTDQWDYNSYITFFSAGAIWGAIGPWRFFGPGSPYFSLLLAFPIGVVLPLIPYIMNKFYPHNLWHLINIPVMTNIPSPGGAQVFIMTPLIISFFSQFYAYRYKYPWFSKYNYIVSAGFDAGSGVMLFILFTLQSFNILPSFPFWQLNPATSQDYYCFDGTDYLNQPVSA